MHCAIVAGGLGTRAVGMTANRIPKALLPVGGIPIIFRQLRVLRREGVTRVSVLAGHLGDQLQLALAPKPGARNGTKHYCRAGATWNGGFLTALNQRPKKR